MASSGVDFLGQYKAISNKLKRRFLRKPNVAEASEQFSYLAKQLQQQECPQYAAFSCLALARCEQTICNPAGEAQALIEAGRLFLTEEKQNYDLKCPSFNEHLNSAINCFNHAIRVYLEQNHHGLAAALCLEMGNALKRFNKVSEAISYFRKGADLFSESPLECLSAKEHLVSCLIDTGDHDQALNVLTEMAQIIERVGGEDGPIGAFADRLADCEVTMVLLLLLLSPGPQRLSSDHSQLLEKYAWVETNDFHSTVLYLGEDLFLLLQSLVMAHQSNDLESMKTLQSDLWPLLTCQQNDILQLIITNICKKKASS